MKHTLNSFDIKTTVSIDKDKERFKKWFRMAFPNYANIKYLRKLPVKDKYTETSFFKLRKCSTSVDHSSSKISTTSNVLNKNIESNFENDALSNDSSNAFKFYHSEFGLRKFRSKNKNVFERRLIKGPPKLFRWIAWLVAAGVPFKRSKEEYINWLDKEVDQEIITQIEKDVSRTLSEGYDLFKSHEAQSSLFRILKAIAALDPELGYCQGINFLAGYVLAICDFEEIESFYFLSSLLSTTYSSKMGVRGFFLDSFPHLSCLLYVFDKLFEEKLPKVHSHFKYLDIPNETWVSKWFQTLFTICLPPTLCSRLWDCLFVEGVDFMLKFAIALLRLLQKSLLNIDDVVDLADYFKRMNPYTLKQGSSEVSLNEEELVKTALKENITTKEIDLLKKDWEKANNVSLIECVKVYKMPRESKEIQLNAEEEYILFNRERKQSFRSNYVMSDMEGMKDENRKGIVKQLAKYTPFRSRNSKKFVNEIMASDEKLQLSMNYVSEYDIERELNFDEFSDSLSHTSNNESQL